MSLGEQILVLVIYVLAVMRLTRLINADTILDRPRLAIAARAKAARLEKAEANSHGQASRFTKAERAERRWNTTMYFVQCPWCVGMWLTLASAWVPLSVPENPVVRYVAVALAVSHLIGVMARFADTEEIDIEDVDAE